MFKHKQHKTHWLMLTMERADKKRNKLIDLSDQKYTHTTKDHLITYLLLFHGNEGSGQREKQVTPGQTYTHNIRPFSETHSLMMAMEGADKKRNR